MIKRAKHKNNAGSASDACRIILIAFSLCFFLLGGASRAGQLPGNRWNLLAISYPPDRDIVVSLGGAERTLTTTGTCKVRAKKDSASFDIEIKDLPAAAQADWTGRQYVLWAIDREKRTLNLGPVPLRGKSTKWSVQVPFRAFGLLVTAEQNPKAAAPSTAVAVESLLPADPDLVVPVYRIEVALVPPPG